MKSLIDISFSKFKYPILRKLRAYCTNTFFKRSYAQEGEDIVLSRIFSGKNKGFYVDVGAHHPMRFSNTYYFYKLGWKGVNVEPNPDAINLFKKYRPRDNNLNCGVAKNKGSIEYFMFDEPALNTFDVGVLNNRLTETSYKHIKTIKIDVVPLKDIFKEYISVGAEIDFLTVDVEGLDLEVLMSNDWEKYRPHWVLAEQLNLENIENLHFELHRYMKSIGYVLFAKTFNTLFYKDVALS